MADTSASLASEAETSSPTDRHASASDDLLALIRGRPSTSGSSIHLPNEIILKILEFVVRERLPSLELHQPYHTTLHELRRLTFPAIMNGAAPSAQLAALIETAVLENTRFVLQFSTYPLEWVLPRLGSRVHHLCFGTNLSVLATWEVRRQDLTALFRDYFKTVFPQLKTLVFFVYHNANTLLMPAGYEGSPSDLLHSTYKSLREIAPALTVCLRVGLCAGNPLITLEGPVPSIVEVTRLVKEYDKVLDDHRQASHGIRRL